MISPESKTVETGVVDVNADNGFIYSFDAGVERKFDFDNPMEAEGNYRMVVSYFTLDFDREIVEFVFEFNP